MYVTHDRSLVDGGQSKGASDWPLLFPFGGELGYLRAIVASGYASLVRWSSRLPGRDIHVSSMSDTWLRMHDAEHSKHRAEM